MFLRVHRESGDRRAMARGPSYRKGSKHDGVPGSGWPRTQLALSAVVLAAALVLGGGQGTLGDTAVQLLALALLAVVFTRQQREFGVSFPRWTWLPVLVVVLVPLLQLLPLPPGLWTGLSGRAELGAGLAAAGTVPAARWGLNPTGSERALFWLLPAIALYLSALRLSSRHRALLVLLLLGLALVHVLLGLAQLADGRGSPLRFYANTNPTEAVGFFANRNHFAGLLALALPLALAWAARAVVERHDDHSKSLLRIAIGAGLCLMLILGLAMSRSRAGMLLGMIAMLLTVPILLGLQQKRGLRRVLFATFMVSTLLVVQFALFGVLQRFGQDPLDDGRWTYADNTVRAAAAYAPLGSGLGTFRQAYQPFERDSSQGQTAWIINHAHNDYLELWLETGWILLPAAIVLLGTLAYAAAGAWRAGYGRVDPEVVHRRALVVATATPLLHSLVDYPLRTSACMAVFGLLCGLLVAAALPRSQRSPSGPLDVRLKSELPPA